MNPFVAFCVALSFLTSIPVRLKEVRDAHLGASIACFPIVGLLLGLVLAGAATLARPHLSAELTALGLVALLAALTGALHLDGVADVFDGLAGRRGDRQRMLTIMRDSRIGSVGATALVLVLAGKVLALRELLQATPTWPLIMFPVVARGAAALLVVGFPSARTEGLGHAFHAHGRFVHAALAAVVTVLIVAPVGPAVLWPSVAGLLAALAIAAWMLRRLGGLTGDVYGAAIEFSELAFLVLAARRP